MRSSERCLIQPDNDSGLATYVFTPSLFHLVPQRLGFSLFERAKLLLRVIRGYTVYYQTDGTQMAGYCFLKHNYLSKYAFVRKHDVLINPYYVSPAFRGHGLGGALIRTAIEDTKTSWHRVYAVVKEENIPSLRTLEKLNFTKAGYSEKGLWQHKLTQRQTELPVFCLTRSEEQEKNA